MASRPLRTPNAQARKRQSARPVRNGHRHHQGAKPPAAFRQRGGSGVSPGFCATEVWHEPTGQEEIQYKVQPAGRGYIHPATVQDLRDRLSLLPARFTDQIEFVQLSRMTRKRAIFPCYGMQWGPNIYLYPIEESLEEFYGRPPTPSEAVEVRMYGGEWSQVGSLWRLKWTERAIKDFYLNNVLIHEVGHVVDYRNSNSRDRERYADWFAIEYGYRASRGRR